MATNYGVDTACVTDIGATDVWVTDPKQLVGERIARALQTPRGALAAIGDDANRGWDVRQYLNGKMGPNDQAVAAQQIQAECLNDEEVSACGVSLSLSNGALAVTLTVTLSNGPTFTMTLTVTQLTASLIFGA